jgi:hypothetical protein
MRRVLLLVVMIGLLGLELALLEAYLPYEWSDPISERVDRFFHTEPYAPHPNMDWEFELDFRQHPSHRIAMYVITAILATGNAFLIAKVWKTQKRLAESSSPNKSS